MFVLFKLYIYFRLISDDDSEIKRPQNPKNEANFFEIYTYR